MTAWSQGCVASVVSGLADAAVTADAAPMAAYMRHHFPFLGVKAPARKSVVRTALAAAGPPVDEVDVVDAVDRLWALPEREYRYAGCLLANRFTPAMSPAFIDHLSRWIVADAWWDTCDPLARGCAGKLVRRHPELRPTMNRWLSGDDLWLTRSALIHMGGWNDAIDRRWVFDACLACAEHPDFFIGKAIGWILRDLARVEPRAVVDFVEGEGATVLSALSKREALKNISVRRSGAAPAEPVPQRSEY